MLEVTGTLNRISTTTDGGWRVTLDFPGDNVTGVIMSALATMRGQSLNITIEELK